MSKPTWALLDGSGKIKHYLNSAPQKNYVLPEQTRLSWRYMSPNSDIKPFTMRYKTAQCEAITVWDDEHYESLHFSIRGTETAHFLELKRRVLLHAGIEDVLATRYAGFFPVFEATSSLLGRLRWLLTGYPN